MLNVNIVYNNEFDNKMEIKFRNLIHRVRDFILKSKIFLNIKVFINIVWKYYLICDIIKIQH